MNRIQPHWVACGFGAAIVASGLYRFLAEPGGYTGLWFGIVMGAIAILAGGLFWRGQNMAAKCSVWVSIVVVGGWFVYEALIKKGLSNPEPRMMIIIAITLFTGIFFARRPVSDSNPANIAGQHAD